MLQKKLILIIIIVVLLFGYTRMVFHPDSHSKMLPQIFGKTVFLPTESFKAAAHQSQTQVHSSRNTAQSLSTQYVEHDAIFIDGNTNFSDTAKAENWPGDGTPSNPYFIDGLNITPSWTNSIQIQNTNVFFRINNCLISRGYYGIYLSFVQNGYISNNIISNNSLMGIFSEKYENCIISGNTISNNGWSGIHSFSRNCTISGNTISNNSWSGIIFSSNSENCTISGNTISNNSQLGIVLGGNNNLVNWNDFIGNNLGETSQASDSGQNNTFAYNYWSDWISPDVNEDGIVDKPYSIDGETNNEDLYPLVFSFHSYSTTPTIEAIGGGIPGFSFLALIVSISIPVLRKRYWNKE